MTGQQTFSECNDLGIELPDGTRLSARFWLPDSSEIQPVPAILEYLPYRKSDGTAARDDTMHPHFAKHGYACVRVDARGCGDSQGLFDDEYSEQELQDGVDIVHWLASQPWCSGAVGMQGISWGGFNGLQIAARNPEPLKAIITIGSTVDRYADDIHYKGGVQLSENIGWAATALSWFSMPPDPAVVGNSWRDTWLNRLENTPFLASTWLRHPNRDDYWKHGSVCEDYSAIKAAVLSLGGLHDGYRNTMSHLASNLSSPVKAIAGPWNHKYPHITGIAPSMDYLSEALRWWDHWLKGIDNGVSADPAYRAYLMDSTTPAENLCSRSGHWVAEQHWPSQNIQPKCYRLGAGTLGDVATSETIIEPDLAVGQACGEYFPFGFGPGELPGDQQADDALSACFETAVLEEPMDLLGAPQLNLELSSDKPQAQIIARLCDVRPDGTSMLISLGLLNLRHRNGFETAEDLIPAEICNIQLSLDQCAYRVPAGHRLRLALSSSYWPYAWPDAEFARLSLSDGELSVPHRPTSAGTEWRFNSAPAPSKRPSKQLAPIHEEKQHTVENSRSTLHILGDDGKHHDLVSGIITSSKLEERWTIDRNNPNSADVNIQWQRSFGRDDWQVNTELNTRMWADEHWFYVEQFLQAWDNNELVFSKFFEDKVERYPNQ